MKASKKGKTKKWKELEKRVLVWVNKIRKKYFNAKPIKKLPTGHMEMGEACVIHNSFRKQWDDSVVVTTDETLIGKGKQEIILHHPKYIAQFIFAFDQGKYPKLVAK